MTASTFAPDRAPARPTSRVGALWAELDSPITSRRVPGTVPIALAAVLVALLASAFLVPSGWSLAYSDAQSHLTIARRLLDTRGELGLVQLGTVWPLVQIWLPPWLLVFGLVNMIVMNLLMVISSGLAAWQRYSWRIAAFTVFLPIYWLLHAIAAWRAAFQLAYDPFGWEKTPHGLTEEYDDGTLDTGGLPHSAST